MGLALFVQNLIIGQVLFLQKHRHACESARNVFDCLPYQQCDWVIGAIAISNSRMILVDFSHGYLYSSIAFFIPMPNSANYIAAVAKPFQIPV